MPLRLRGTKLRKYIATRCITLNLSDLDITQLADYLGHDKSIHRQSIPQLEIVKMSRLLKIAQGEEHDFEDDIQQNDFHINTDKDNFTVNKTLQVNNDSDSDSDTNLICNTTNKRKKRSSKYI